jgi:hypothetical protein
MPRADYPAKRNAGYGSTAVARRPPLDPSEASDYSRCTSELEAMMAHRIVGQPIGKLEGIGKVSGPEPDVAEADDEAFLERVTPWRDEARP